MLNLFKKLEGSEKSSEKISNKNETLVNQENPGSEADLEIKLAALSSYFLECETNGIELTGEMVEKEIYENLGLDPEDLLEKEIKDPQIAADYQSVVETVKRMTAEKAEQKGTVLSFLREKVFGKKIAKLAFVSALLLLKFNPLQAAEKEKAVVKESATQEVVKPDLKVGGEPDDTKTFKTSAEDFEHLQEVVISANNHFETNKADLKEVKVFENKLNNFLSSINAGNFASLMAQDWVVEGSSDERPTGWENGNEGLTKARIEAVRMAVIKTISSHDFSGKLSEPQIKALLAKEILASYPQKGQEKGVTYLTDLNNPETGEKYTAEEIKVLKAKNPVKYNKLLDSCRYTNFELKAKSKIFENNKDYNRYYVLIDGSGSMQDNREAMSQELKQLNIDKPFFYANFSDNIGSIKLGLNSKDLSEKIMKYYDDGLNSGDERAFTSAISMLERIDKANANLFKSKNKIPNSLLYIATDESLQDVDLLDKVKELSERNNVDIKFIVFSPTGDRSVKLTLEEVEEQIKANNFVKTSNGRMTLNKIVDEYGRDIFSK